MNKPHKDKICTVCAGPLRTKGRLFRSLISSLGNAILFCGQDNVYSIKEKSSSAGLLSEWLKFCSRQALNLAIFRARPVWPSIMQKFRGHQGQLVGHQGQNIISRRGTEAKGKKREKKHKKVTYNNVVLAVLCTVRLTWRTTTWQTFGPPPPFFQCTNKTLTFSY